MSKISIGNISGFGKEFISNFIYILGVGYMGGSITSICTSKKIDALFPYDIHEYPYVVPKPVGVIHTILGYPYSFRKKIKTEIPKPGKKAQGDLYNEFINWYIDTWSFVFAFWRELLNYGAVEGKELYKGLFGNLFLFYAMPYLLFYYIYYFLPFVSFALAFLGSMSEEYSFIFTFSFITAWIYGFGICDELSPGCIINAVMLGIIGIIVSFSFIPWWIIISVAASIYFNVFLILSPFFKNAPGIHSVFEEIKKHNASLTILFMILTVRSSATYLIPQVTSGFYIGFIYILYLLYKSNKKK